MSYHVGVDLGTTYTAAAVHRDGVATIFSLGSRSAVIPSVVLLRSDGTILTGDAAERRAMSEPERVVREFKRRLGDATPIIIGGTPYSAEALTARLLESVLAEIHKREDGPPSRIVVCHPANWGNYKRDLLQQAIRLAGLDLDTVGLITEPEAAALSYAAQERVEPGQVVAVYDLGGGTFDAAVLRRTVAGFSILGKPEGIERLGGIDFDAAVFAQVTGGIGDVLQELDPDNPTTLAAVARLRHDCVEAKEALSSDTDTSVPVMLPNLQTEVRITRQEFEALIRPSLLDSLEAMRRAVRSAGLEFDDVSRVLLVGGSSRIPLIAQLVSSQLGRPVGVDAHPKHAVAIGASLAASGLLERAAADAGAAEGVPLDPLVTVVATPEELAGARQSVRSQAVPQAGPGKAQPVPPAVVRAMPAPQAGPGKAQPVPPAVVGGAMPAPPLGSPGKAQPVPPAVVGGVMPAPQAGPGKAQPVANPGPPPQADGPSGRHGGPSPGLTAPEPAGRAPQPVPQPTTPRPAPPPASLGDPGTGWSPAAPGAAFSRRSSFPVQPASGHPHPETEPTTVYRPGSDAERTSVMPGSGSGRTTPYPHGLSSSGLSAPGRPYQQPSPARGSRGGWLVLMLVVVALVVVALIILATQG